MPRSDFWREVESLPDAATSRAALGVAGISVAATALYYVDAVHGSDAYDGLSIASAKATFASAIAALPANGGTIIHLPGTNIETVTLPVYPKVVNILQVNQRCIIQAPAINTPAIRCAASAVEQGFIKVTVQPHALGTTGGLILCDGMRFMHVDATYIDNGTGGADRLFDVRANGGACYFNLFIPRVYQSAHLNHVVKSGNAGTAVSNANANTVIPDVYACSNMTCVLDLGDTTAFTILPGHIEANTGAIALIPGNSTTVVGATYFEANAANDIVPAAMGARSVDAHNVRFNGTYHANSAMTIPTGLVGWEIAYGGTFTITDTDNWAKNRKSKDGVITGPGGSWPVWTAVAGGIGFQNAWQDVGGSPAMYRKHGDGRLVALAGQITTGASGATAFTLPVGYRPTTTKILATSDSSTGGHLMLVVNSNGNVTLFGGANGDGKSIDAIFAIDV